MTKAERVEQLEDGNWLYEDGTIRHPKGYLVEKPPWAPANFDKETGREMAHRRWHELKEQRIQAIVEAVREGAMEVGDIIEADKETFKVLVREGVLNEEVPFRDRVSGWEKLWKHAGLIAEEKTQAAAKVTIELSNEVLDRLMAIEHGDVIDVEAKEVEPLLLEEKDEDTQMPPV